MKCLYHTPNVLSSTSILVASEQLIRKIRIYLGGYKKSKLGFIALESQPVLRK